VSSELNQGLKYVISNDKNEALSSHLSFTAYRMFMFIFIYEMKKKISDMRYRAAPPPEPNPGTKCGPKKS
jgi:hypothetical protein